ncbi:acyl carrier protein [Streptomyces sp. NPDC053720]|uniref:acyl carrier protein n=1 Tax=Streptomyces sp. NPDC053720 TaxID=3154855 RepID=UPI003439E729
MIHDPIPEHLAWLQRVFMEKLHTEIQASDRPWEHGMDSITAAAVGVEIRRRYDIPLRVSWEWLMTLTTEGIATRIASTSAEPEQGPHNTVD